MHQFPSVVAALGDDVSTPAPIVLIDVVQENIARMQAFAEAHGKRLRPHVKTHKSIEIGRLQLAAGASGLTAGNLSEAEIFARAGCESILLAYPLWPAGSKGERLLRLASEVELSVGVESREAVDALAAAMGTAAGRLGVVVEMAHLAHRPSVLENAAYSGTGSY